MKGQEGDGTYTSPYSKGRREVRRLGRGEDTRSLPCMFAMLNAGPPRPPAHLLPPPATNGRSLGRVLAQPSPGRLTSSRVEGSRQGDPTVNSRWRSLPEQPRPRPSLPEVALSSSAFLFSPLSFTLGSAPPPLRPFFPRILKD